MGPSDPATSTATSKSYAVPKLVQDGLNCITWKSQTLAMLAVGQGVTHHIEGTARQPHQIPTFPTNRQLMSEEEDHLEKAEKRWDDYYQWEATIKAQVFTTILLKYYVKILD